MELKELVKRLHAAGIEVVLDVVFNHTSEGDHRGPTLSLRGLDEASYYLLDEAGRHHNFSGAGNTLNANLHYMTGFWILMPLAMLSATGAWISFPSVFSAFESGPPRFERR